MKPEPHIKRVAKDDLPEHMQKSWDGSMALHKDATFVETFGNAPHMYDWYMDDFYKKVFYSGRIETSVIELVRLRLANIHGCAHCNRGDKVAAREAGVSEEQIEGLDDYENGPFTEKEKAALALTDVMVLTNPMGSVTKEIHERCAKHFTDGEMMEMGVIMAVLCGMAKSSSSPSTWLKKRITARSFRVSKPQNNLPKIFYAILLGTSPCTSGLRHRAHTTAFAQTTPCTAVLAD